MFLKHICQTLQQSKYKEVNVVQAKQKNPNGFLVSRWGHL